MIVAISGWKRSGKDTAAEYLIKEKGFKRVGFADPLKEMVAEEYNIPLNYCYDDEYKESPLLQYPVDPKDDFTLTITKLLGNEFKNEEGESYKQLQEEGGDEAVLTANMYWTPRALCILKGSINRAVTSDYWVSKALEKMQKELDSGAPGVVISDLRYRSEVEQLREHFSDKLTTIRINRFDSVDTTDPSERDLDDHKFDYTIQNKGTIENLQHAITGALIDANIRKS